MSKRKKNQDQDRDKEAIDVRQVVSNMQESMKHIRAHTQDFNEGKAQLEDAGYSKKQVSEFLKMLKQQDDERNLTITGANMLLQEAGRKPIDPNVEVVGSGDGDGAWTEDDDE